MLQTLFLVADTQLYKRLCPSVRWSVPENESKSGKNERFRSFLGTCLCWKGGWMGCWVWMGFGCPCPPARNDLVTPRHLFFSQDSTDALSFLLLFRILLPFLWFGCCLIPCFVKQCKDAKHLCPICKHIIGYKNRI